jgi:phage shock protein A
MNPAQEEGIMSILARMIRMFKADIHGVMDQLEDKELLLKQYLRDMETALAQKEARLRTLVSSQKQIQQDYDKHKLEIEKLEKDLSLAIEKERDDLSRMLIKKLKPLVALREELDRQLEALTQEIAQFKDCIEHQRMQYSQLKHRSTEYFRRAEQQKWDKILSTSTPDISALDLNEEAVELELLHRKEAFKGGLTK